MGQGRQALRCQARLISRMFRSSRTAARACRRSDMSALQNAGGIDGSSGSTPDFRAPAKTGKE
jgi:hypothetical protein